MMKVIELIAIIQKACIAEHPKREYQASISTTLQATKKKYEL